MRFRKGALLLFAAAPFFAGCAGFWAPPASTTSGCSTGCTTSSSDDFYILNAPSSGSPQIVGEQIVSGNLTAISNGTATLPATPYAMALSPSGSFLYVSTTAGVYVYPINSGALGSPTQVTEDTAALAIQIDPTGAWLLEAIQATGGVTVAAVPLNTSTGADSGAEQTTTATISNASVQNGKMAISSDGKYAFIALGAGGTVIVPFNAGAASGASPFGASAYTVPVLNSSGSALSVAVDPSLRLFYIGETLADSAGTSGGIRAIEYSSIGGTLVQASGSPIASGGLAPNAILPAGSSYLYIANGAGTSSAGTINQLTVVSSSTSSYTISSGASIASGIQPYALAEDGTDTFILAVNSLGAPYFSSYTFDTTTAGKLDQQIFTNTGTSPISIIALP